MGKKVLSDHVKQIYTLGYFSEYLPIEFTSEHFLELVNLQLKETVEKPYIYTMNKNSSSMERRTISIPEVGSFLTLVKHLTTCGILDKIICNSKINSHSLSKILTESNAIRSFANLYPKINATVTEQNIESFIDNTVLKLRKSLGARGILRLDISNFYGSFYTHNISCIGRGHNWAENQFRLSFENNASQEYKELAKLDKLVQGINQKRTHGLLIGPVTSFIIAEGLMTTIDDELSHALKTKLNKEIDFVRFIDDYDVFIQSEEDIPFILQTFTQILDKYGFVLGDSKTEFIKFPFYIYEDFKEIMIKEQELTSSKELLNIYSKLANLELAVKQKGGLFYFASHLEQLINDSNYSDAISLLLSLIKENAKSIPVACKTIIKHCKNGNQNFKKSVFNNMFNYLIGCIDKQYDWEQIWLIYTLIKLDSDMFKSKLPSIVTKHLSELAVVIIINEYVCEETLQNSFIEQAKNSSWLLKYELYRLNIVDEQFINTCLLDPKAIINFNILKENNIRLYKVQYNC